MLNVTLHIYLYKVLNKYINEKICSIYYLKNYSLNYKWLINVGRYLFTFNK